MAQISVRVDDAVKHEAEQTFDEIGLSMNTAITIFLKACAREKRIPFELTADPFYSSCQSALSGRHHAGCAQRQGAFCPA